MGLYAILKLIHILATVAFLGNIYTGLFWMNRAHRTRDLAIINHTMKNIILSDKYFTVPGVVIILIGGLGAAIQNHLPILRLGWIFWPIVLFSISGIAFSWKIVPLQKKSIRLPRRIPIILIGPTIDSSTRNGISGVLLPL